MIHILYSQVPSACGVEIVSLYGAFPLTGDELDASGNATHPCRRGGGGLEHPTPRGGGA